MSGGGITTILEARLALEQAIQDTVADHGEEAAEQGYFDLVRYVAEQIISDKLRAEFLRREGL